MVRIASATVIAFVIWAVAAKDIIDHSGDNGADKKDGKQFINGKCSSNADCATDCCAKFIDNGQAKGVCSGNQADTLNGKQGCGSFGDGAVNGGRGKEQGSGSGQR